MEKYKINNFRMAGYLLLAFGLINWRYQSGSANILRDSLVLIAPGLLLLLLTFMAPGRELLNSKAATYFTGVILLLLIVFSFIA